MIYLNNSTDIQQVYIPRQEIKKDAVSKYVSENELYDAIANETARTEETYQKIVEMSAYSTTNEVESMIDDAVSGKMDTSAMSAYSTTEQVEDMITAATDGLASEEWVNDQGFLKEHQSLSAYSTTEQMNQAIGAATAATTGWVESQGYLTEHQSLSAYSTTQQMNTAINNATSGKMDTSAMSAYTPTSGFATINGSAITEGGDIIIQGGGEEYSAGTNIEIVDNVISVTGITIPTSNTAFTNDAGYITSGDAQTQIDNSISGKVDTSAMTSYWTSAETENAITAATEDFVTSADVETQITDKGYITGYTETDPVFQASAASGITANDIQNWDSKLDSSALTPYYTSAQTDTAISNATSGLASETYVDNAVSGKADTSAFTEYWTSAETQSAITAATDDMATQTWVGQQGYLTAFTETDPVFGASAASGITSGDISNWNSKVDASALTNYATNEYVNEIEQVTASALTELHDTKLDASAMSAYTPTSGFSTINGSAITDGSAIVIQGGSGGTNIIELTQAEYNALTAYTPDAVYVITDAEEINLDDFVTSGDLQTQISSALTPYYTSAQTDTAISNAVSGKTDKVSVTASSSGYKFPRWNNQGCITGTSATAYQASQNINGSSRTLYSTSSSALPTIYAPTSAGTAGQPLLSNGSGAPVWGSYKFSFITQSAYDALVTKDSTTIYFIVG